jgi:hypothetical protein
MISSNFHDQVHFLTLFTGVCSGLNLVIMQFDHGFFTYVRRCRDLRGIR